MGQARLPAAALAVLGAAAGAALWIVFGLAFPNLTFHFQPGVVGALAGYAARRGRRGELDVVAIVVSTAVFVPVGAAALHAADRHLDPAGAVIVVAVVGLAIGLLALRRR